MQPDAIEFYTKFKIPRNQDKYNYWLEELEKTIPGFVIREMPDYSREDNSCGMWFGIDLLMDRGGMYFTDNLIVLKPFRHLRSHDFEFGTINEGSSVSFIMSVEGNRNKLAKLREIIKLSDTENSKELKPNSYTNCEILGRSVDVTFDETICGELSEIRPVDIMYTKTSTAALLRYLFYNNQSIMTADPKLPGQIPKIVHLVWFNSKEMDFIQYLSLRSVLSVVKPEKVYIHGDGQLTGEYMSKLEKDPRVQWVLRERPRYIYGRDVLYTQHKSDIIRADVLLKYGGIYMDWDVLWVRPIDNLLNRGEYDAIVNFDHMPVQDFPDTMNLGVLMAKPGSEFVQKWQDALVNYRSMDFYYNAILLPYKIYERYPSAVHIERHLQVMCFQLKCHPTFEENYKNFNEEQSFDWKTDVYAVHITHPDPKELKDQSTMSKATGMFADIGNFILSQPYEFD